MDIEKKAIDRLRQASDLSMRLYQAPLVITYSGGKDSDVLLQLAERSGIPFEVIHSLTTADAPQTVQHVKQTFRRLEDKGIKCTIDRHVQPDGTRTTMWNLIPRKVMPPTRLVRYCCAALKESDCKGRFIATGVRWAESTARAKRSNLEVIVSKKSQSVFLDSDNAEDRRVFERCKMKGKRVTNPIIDWSTSDVYQYIAAEKININPLYSCGFSRVGCIGCPMAGKKGMQMEFAQFPAYKAMYLRAFEQMLAVREARGLARVWESAEDVFHWWVDDGVLPGQEALEGFDL